jgi:hypothetical protein
MDPVTVVVTALLAGTAGGVSSTASTAVHQAYDALCAAVRTRLRGHDEEALDAYLADPDAARDRLRDTLSTVGADPELVAAARAVLGEQPGKYTVDASNATNVQTGDFNVQNIKLS